MPQCLFADVTVMMGEWVGDDPMLLGSKLRLSAGMNCGARTPLILIAIFPIPSSHLKIISPKLGQIARSSFAGNPIEILARALCQLTRPHTLVAKRRTSSH